MKKQTKNLITSIVVIAVIAGGGFGLMSLGNKSGTTNFSIYSASALVAYEDHFDFGTIQMNDGLVRHEFEVKNEGTESVTIGKVYTSCMCTGAYIEDSTGKKYGKFGMPGHGVSSQTEISVAPGETVMVEAIFDPAAHGPSGVGLAQRSIYIETNSQTSPKIELAFEATVTR